MIQHSSSPLPLVTITESCDGGMPQSTAITGIAYVFQAFQHSTSIVIWLGAGYEDQTQRYDTDSHETSRKR